MNDFSAFANKQEKMPTRLNILRSFDTVGFPVVNCKYPREFSTWFSPGLRVSLPVNTRTQTPSWLLRVTNGQFHIK